MEKKKSVQSNDKVIKRLEEEGHHVSFLTGTTSFIDVGMSQTVDIKDKKVMIIDYRGGNKGLLIDGKQYNMEIMLYEKRDDDEIVEATFDELGMRIMDYGNTDIHENNDD